MLPYLGTPPPPAAITALMFFLNFVSVAFSQRSKFYNDSVLLKSEVITLFLFDNNVKIVDSPV